MLQLRLDRTCILLSIRFELAESPSGTSSAFGVFLASFEGTELAPPIVKLFLPDFEMDSMVAAVTPSDGVLSVSV